MVMVEREVERRWKLVGTVLDVVRVCEIGWSDRYDRFDISSLSPCGDGQLG